MYTIIYDPKLNKNFIYKAVELMPEKVKDLIEIIRPKTDDDIIFTYEYPDWKQMKFPQKGFIYIQYIEPNHYVAGTDPNEGIGIGVIGHETEETIANRITHEILHDLNYPADDLILHLKQMKNEGYINKLDYFGVIYLGILYYIIIRDRLERAYYKYLLNKYEFRSE